MFVAPDCGTYVTLSCILYCLILCILSFHTLRVALWLSLLANYICRWLYKGSHNVLMK